ncbi:hypothetical protein FF1_011660 [Malus domestica]
MNGPRHNTNNLPPRFLHRPRNPPRQRHLIRPPFNTDLATLSTFSGTPTIHLTIGVSNELLPTLTATLDWLQSNLLAHFPTNQIRYIAVGNKVFLKDPYHTPHVLLTILKLHQALQTLGLDISIKLSSPLSASVLSTSYPPSSASFDPSV